MRSEGGGAVSRAGTRHFVFAPGGSREGTGRYFLSLALFITLGIAFQITVGVILGLVSVGNPALQSAIRAIANGQLSAPWDFFLGLAAVSFGTYILALSIAVTIVHGRKLVTVATDGRRFNWFRVALAFVIYSALLAGPFLLFLATSKTPLTPHFDPASFTKLVAISFFALLIQTSAEEIIFRGYLTQFMGSFTDSLLVIVGVPSLLFALFHIGNPETVNDPSVYTFYFGFGALMALIAYIDRSIELTIGAHFANNFVIAVLVRTPDSIFQTPTLYVLSNTEQSFVVPPLVAPILFFVLSLVLLRRRT